MTVTPLGSASIVVFPAISRIISSKRGSPTTAAALTRSRSKRGALNMDLAAGSGAARGRRRSAAVLLRHLEGVQGRRRLPDQRQGRHRFEKKGIPLHRIEVDLSLPEEITDRGGPNRPRRSKSRPTTSAAPTSTPSTSTWTKRSSGRSTRQRRLHYNDEGERRRGGPRSRGRPRRKCLHSGRGSRRGRGQDGPRTAAQRRRFLRRALPQRRRELALRLPIRRRRSSRGAASVNKIGFDFRRALDKPGGVFDGSATIKSAEVVTATGGFLRLRHGGTPVTRSWRVTAAATLNRSPARPTVDHLRGRRQGLKSKRAKKSTSNSAAPTAQGTARLRPRPRVGAPPDVPLADQAPRPASKLATTPASSDAAPRAKLPRRPVIQGMRTSASAP